MRRGFILGEVTESPERQVAGVARPERPADRFPEEDTAWGGPRVIRILVIGLLSRAVVKSFARERSAVLRSQMPAPDPLPRSQTRHGCLRVTNLHILTKKSREY